MEETGGREDREGDSPREFTAPVCPRAYPRPFFLIIVYPWHDALSVIAAGKGNKTPPTLLVIDDVAPLRSRNDLLSHSIRIGPAITCPGFSRQPSFRYPRQTPIAAVAAATSSSGRTDNWRQKLVAAGVSGCGVNHPVIHA
ncbi:hypothetical protein K0M31_010329 [Melipona bicolor]|uniref:Uncharacterized protein n=1 Tax=Melipona bicolor TaxID=60889 RepID=A0AA40FMB1_9HYME|nr:hypothetical protein K0M31_010329 [Melipona bicolor]